MVHLPQILLALVLAASTLGCAAKPRHEAFAPGKEQAVSEIYRDDVRRVEQLGHVVLEKNLAGLMAMNETLRRKDSSNGEPTIGYISEAIDDRLRVSVVGGSAEAPKVYHRIDVEHREVVQGSYSGFRDGAVLSENAALLWKARTTALTQNPGFCPGTYTTVVLPLGSDPKRPAGYYVYFLWFSTDPGILNIGGHFRIKVGADGDQILESKAFSNSCFQLPTSDPIAPGDSEAVGLYMTHLLAPFPEENHVIASLWNNQTLFVGTTENNSTWKVEKGRISLLK